MKKTWISLLVSAFLLPALSASAQDRQVFNHLSLGLGVGMDGLGLELALPITPYAQVRAGYSIFPYTFNKIYDGPTIRYEDIVLDFPTISYTFWKGGNGKMLLDIFPGKKTPFRITAGVYAGPGDYIHWEADLWDSMPEGDFAKRIFTINGFSFTTDAEGIVKADALMKHWVPYAGLGYGRAVDPGKRLSIMADAGVFITGGTKIVTYNYANNPEGEPVVLRSENLVAFGRQLDKGWANRASDWPVLPMLKISLFLQLF